MGSTDQLQCSGKILREKFQVIYLTLNVALPLQYKTFILVLSQNVWSLGNSQSHNYLSHLDGH